MPFVAGFFIKTKINRNHYQNQSLFCFLQMRTISAAVALACLSLGQVSAQQQGGATSVLAEEEGRAPAASAKEHEAATAGSKTLNEVTVTGERSADEKGHDDVYDKNVTTVYQDREELQRFQATNPGDVFKGMNGVYSMDTRGSQSITPNIRGLTGEGRVPLTIDGTEQSTNIWLHFFGAGNRSYADPALFRSIEVEKGPSLSRGIKSGIGGAVNIRTIEPSDIIPEGKNFGIELKPTPPATAASPGSMPTRPMARITAISPALYALATAWPFPREHRVRKAAGRISTSTATPACWPLPGATK